MFDPQSRYYGLDDATLTEQDDDGTSRLVVYKRRRFLPRPETMSALARYTVKDGDRLDNVTAAYLRDPLQFWRVCDANLTFDPADLVAQPGRVLTIAIPKV